MNERPQALPATTTSADALRGARRLRSRQRLLEALVLAGVASALPAGVFGAWATPMALAAAGFAALVAALARTGAVRTLRSRVGARRIVLHRFGDRLLLDPPNRHVRDWSFDLGVPTLPVGPLLVPGLALGVLGLLQIVPLFGGPTASASPTATRRALLLLAAALALHVAASAALLARAARRRFRRAVAWIGAAVGVTAVAAPKLVSPAPFPTRELVAGYLVLALPIALSRVRDTWRSYRGRLGSAPGVQRQVLALSRREGWRLLEATGAALATAAALIAGGTAGALLALAAGLGLAAAGHRRPRGAAWAAAALLAAAALAWLGLVPVEARPADPGGDASAARAAWGERLDGLHGPGWATGTGLGTASAATAPPLPGWLHLAVEGGWPGVLIAVWAALAVLRRARHAPWLFASLAASVLHGLVRLDVQIPATAMLFVALAAMPERRRRAGAASGSGGDADETLPP